MQHEQLSAMDTKTAAQAVEQASTHDFEMKGGFGGQLIEMRDKNPKAYMQILKAANELAQADNGSNKADALHNLELVDELAHMQSAIKSGNVQEMQSDLAKIKPEDSSERFFVSKALRKGAFDDGFLVRAMPDENGKESLILHKPGSQFGLEITPDHASAYNWTTKKDDPTSAKDVLDSWNKGGSTQDSALLKEASGIIKDLAGQDGITQAMSPEFSILGELESVAYNHGYAGKTGFAAAQAMASDITKATGIDLKMSNEDDQSGGNPRVTVDFKNGANLSSGWNLKWE